MDNSTPQKPQQKEPGPFRGVKPHLRILGIRGIPAAHGGFETVSEYLALYLEARGWKVTVYCQIDHDAANCPLPAIFEETWRGIRLVHIPVNQKGALGTAVFDWKSILHAAGESGLALTLGYNTALFNIPLRLKGIKNVIGMDGIEWVRSKWSWPLKMWFYINEWAGCYLGNHLIADHPEIRAHLARRVRRSKIATIVNGGVRVTGADSELLQEYGVKADNYFIIIARIEPENSIHTIIRAFSRKKRGFKLIVLGTLAPEIMPYHRELLDAASDEVIFPGAIYEKDCVQALRFFARAYCHGHQVGGTNPSLAEALGAGNAVMAHDNKFNRWVAGPGQVYFNNEDECEANLETLISDENIIVKAREAARIRYEEDFSWEIVLGKYETLLNEWLD